MNRRWLAVTLLSFCGLGLVKVTAQQTNAGDDLSGASMEELTQMHLQVNSFSRKDQDLWSTPAAVFVITREDIERSAASSIPELLRMVPGVQVAQLTASTWAVSARGFNGAFANKLLVLIDGRTFYSEIYSGAHWDQEDIPFDEIERIEVIRGPGAAVWGTNAVNGVINIITKRARSTQQFEASADISRIDGFAHVREGGSLGDHLQYRGYAFFRQRFPFDLSDGQHAFDGEDSLRGGGRIDWQPNKQNLVSASGDLYGGHMKQELPPGYSAPDGVDRDNKGSMAGGYVLGRWERKSTRADSALQFYFDDTSRHEVGTYYRSRTFDAEYQDHLSLGGRNDMVWGAGFRLTADHIAAQFPLTTKPEYTSYIVDGFMQDELVLKPRRLVLTLGSKIQEGTLAGFQVQPSVRLLWSPTTKESVWAAVSRAATASSIQDRSVIAPLLLGTESGIPITGTLYGNPAIKPETVLAYEAGYRQRVAPNLTVDIACFFNLNRRLLVVAMDAPVLVPGPPFHIVENSMYTNGFNAKTGGIEVAVSWKATKTLSFAQSYTWMQIQATQTHSGMITAVDTWSTPHNAVTSSLSWQFHPGWSFDAFVARSGTLGSEPSFSVETTSAPTIPAFTRVDLHARKKVGRYLDLNVSGTNLLASRHLEFGGGTADLVPDYIPRSVAVGAGWTF
jgi:iron complex outermembrane receptor protein